MDDPFNLQRFLAAQDAIFDQVCAELADGQKRSHWMWFIFPQIAGLGSSDMARLYAISSPKEAAAYLGHETLGPRLRTCTALVLSTSRRPIERIFGHVDAQKFRSSMTLFAQVSNENCFVDSLKKYFDGDPDPLTLRKLSAPPARPA